MSAKRQERDWAAEPLPRGRHKLARSEVVASQRARLLRAMGELVGAHGYEATTVPQVTSLARVSRSAFYEQFADKTDCFIAYCEELSPDLWAALTQHADDPDARTALRNGIRTYLGWWQARPEFTRAYLVELPLAGPRAIVDRERAYDQFELILRFIALRARNDEPSLPPVRDVALRAAVLATTEIVAAAVRDGRLDELDGLADDLDFLLARLLF